MKNFIVILFFSSIVSNSYSQHIEVKLHSTTDYEGYEDFAKAAIVQMEKVLNSDEFKNKLMEDTYKRTNGLTNKELLQKIKLAREEQGPGGQDRVVDLRVRTLRINSDESRWKNKCKIGSRAGTIGIDGNGDGVTAICPQRLEKWFKENNLGSLAGHYTHEYLHIIGFNHRKWLSTNRWRQKTFVYKIGNLVRDLVNKNMKE